MTNELDLPAIQARVDAVAELGELTWSEATHGLPENGPDHVAIRSMGETLATVDYSQAGGAFAEMATRAPQDLLALLTEVARLTGQGDRILAELVAAIADVADSRAEVARLTAARDAALGRLAQVSAVLRGIPPMLASIAPAGCELRPDGTEDPGMAAYVEGLREAYSNTCEAVDMVFPSNPNHPDHVPVTPETPSPTFGVVTPVVAQHVRGSGGTIGGYLNCGNEGETA